MAYGFDVLCKKLTRSWDAIVIFAVYSYEAGKILNEYPADSSFLINAIEQDEEQSAAAFYKPTQPATLNATG